MTLNIYFLYMFEIPEEKIRKIPKDMNIIISEFNN